ncbi:MAG: hypothetical protein KDD22_07750, partial [Bdellovibrionales bacterium]|nr:hypothetical protein [Bdellovibrionales bacterium]
ENESRWPAVENLLEQAIRKGEEGLPVPRGDVLEMWVLLQYLETFFARFDEDQSKTINVQEALKAFPIFQPVLGDLVPLDSEDIRPFFTFLFRYGETPFYGPPYGNGLKFNYWRWHEDQWSFEADRVRVLEILAALNGLIN